MRIINLLPNPIYFVYLGLIAFCAFILLLPTMMFEPVTGYWSYWSPDGSKIAAANSRFIGVNASNVTSDINLFDFDI